MRNFAEQTNKSKEDSDNARMLRNWAGQEEDKSI